MVIAKPIDQVRWSLRHGGDYGILAKLVAYFTPGGYLSAYTYVAVDADNDTTIFDVIYNSETHTRQDVYLELELVFRSLGLKVS